MWRPRPLQSTDDSQLGESRRRYARLANDPAYVYSNLADKSSVYEPVFCELPHALIPSCDEAQEDRKEGEEQTDHRRCNDLASLTIVLARHLAGGRVP